MEERNVRRRLTPAPRWAAVVLAVAVLVLVALIALGARGLPGTETRPPPFPVTIDLLVAVRIMMGIAAVTVALVVILLLLPGGPAIKLPERKKSSPFRLLAAIVLLFAILMILQPFAGQQEEPPPVSAGTAIDEEIEPLGIQRTGSRWGLIVLAGAVLLVVLGVAVATRPAVDEEEATEMAAHEQFGEVIEAVLADLNDSNDPREVVIGAYARMERALSSAGLPRRASEAPLEYLARSLRRLEVSRRATTRLTRLFEIARFSDHDIPSEMAVEARESLRAIRDELSWANR